MTLYQSILTVVMTCYTGSVFGAVILDPVVSDRYKQEVITQLTQSRDCVAAKSIFIPFVVHARYTDPDFRTHLPPTMLQKVLHLPSTSQVPSISFRSVADFQYPGEQGSAEQAFSGVREGVAQFSDDGKFLIRFTILRHGYVQEGVWDRSTGRFTPTSDPQDKTVELIASCDFKRP